MTQAEQSRTSRSLAIYGLLLELYPRSYLQQHRAEMLQNFQDFEQASPSKAALWLFLGKDLAVSFRSQFTKTLWGQTVIVILVLAVLLVCTERRAPARVQSTEGSVPATFSAGSPDVLANAGKPPHSAAPRATSGRYRHKPRSF